MLHILSRLFAHHPDPEAIPHLGVTALPTLPPGPTLANERTRPHVDGAIPTDPDPP